MKVPVITQAKQAPTIQMGWIRWRTQSIAIDTIAGSANQANRRRFWSIDRVLLDDTCNRLRLVQPAFGVKLEGDSPAVLLVVQQQRRREWRTRREMLLRG